MGPLSEVGSEERNRYAPSTLGRANALSHDLIWASPLGDCRGLSRGGRHRLPGAERTSRPGGRSGRRATDRDAYGILGKPELPGEFGRADAAARLLAQTQGEWRFGGALHRT